MAQNQQIPQDDDEWTRQAEENLIALANGAEGEQEKLDREGNVHLLRYKQPPNLDANKFILKNRSKGKWADKTEISVTNVNVNLTASYDEVQALMAQQKKALVAKQEQVVEAEFEVIENGEKVQ